MIIGWYYLFYDNGLTWHGMVIAIRYSMMELSNARFNNLYSGLNILNRVKWLILLGNSDFAQISCSLF